MTSKPQKRPKRLLRNYLLDVKVQLRFTSLMVLISCVLTAGLGYYWYDEMRKASEVIRLNALTALGESAANKLDAELASQDMTRLLLLVGFAVVFALLIGAYGIVVSHRYAGPLFKISRHMADITNGRLYELWGLRKSDQLQDFFETFKTMHGALRERTEADMRLLSKLLASAEECEELEPLLPEIRAMLKIKGDSLRDASSTTMRIDRRMLDSELTK